VGWPPAIVGCERACWQVAVALVLLVAASLLIRSFHRLMDIDPALEARHLLAIAPSASSAAESRSAYGLLPACAGRPGERARCRVRRSGWPPSRAGNEPWESAFH
jgi:hypothetical protein